MNVLFAGTPAIAVPSLRELAAAGKVRAVLTSPDAPAGRGGRLTPSEVKLAARELGLEVLDPPRLGGSEPAVRELGADLLVAVAYGRIFRPSFLNLFPLGGVNLHPSLLPRHRGPTPIPATILAGDPEGGVTVQRLASEVDSGAILGQLRVPLDGTETTASLTSTLAPLGARLLAEVLRALEDGTVVDREQDHERATFCAKLTKDDGRLDWREDAATLGRKVRAYDSYPGTFTTWGAKGLRILVASPLPGGEAASQAVRGGPGIVLGQDNRYGILVSTGSGVLCVRRLQLETRKALDWRAFLNGVPGFVGTQLGGAPDATTVDPAQNRH